MSRARLISLVLIFLPALVARAQNLPVDDQGSGFLPQRSYHISDFDSIDLLTGRLATRIPLLSYPQRGTLPPLQVFVGGDSGATSTFTNWCTSAGPKVTSRVSSVFGTNDAFGVMITPYWNVHEGQAFILPADPACVPTPSYGEITVTDASGTTLYLGGLSGAASTAMTSPDSSVRYDTSTGILTNRKGIQFTVGPFVYTSGNIPGVGNTVTRVQDPSGNAVVRTNLSTVPGVVAGYWTDSVGRVVPDIDEPGNGRPQGGGCFTQSYPAANGGSIPLQFCFGSAGIQSVTFPDGTSWQFSGTAWQPSGGLWQPTGTTSITTPTGATISYQYTGVIPCGSPWGPYTGSFSNLTTAVAGVKTKTVDLHDGTPVKTWTYSYQNYTTTVTDPQGNDTVHTFSSAGPGVCPKVETQTQYFQGSSLSGGTLLKTVNTTYYDPAPNYLPYRNLVDVGVVPKTRTTTWPTGQVTEETFAYDSTGEASYCAVYCGHNNGPYPMFYGNLLQETDYDYGNGSPGPLLRSTNYSYLWQSNANYGAANMLDLQCLATVYGPGPVPQQTSCATPPFQSNQAAQTAYSYDENNGSPQGALGNQTSVSRWLNGGTPAKSQTVFNAQGMPVKTIDALGDATTTTYDSTGAFPSQVQYPATSGISHIEKMSYDANTGLLSSQTDQNNNATSYQYDSMRRLLQIIHPDSGKLTVSYNLAATPPNVQTTRLLDAAGHLITHQTNFDTLGRPLLGMLTSDPDGTDYTATTYDSLGRSYQTYNPTRCNPPTTYCGESTWGFTTTTYDALGRVTSVSAPDGSVATTSYSGNCTTATDQAGKARKSCTDGLGRLSQVFEDPGSSPHLNFETDYTYDSLNNLTRVDQWGGPNGNAGDRVRSFAYDSLSRLASATNPESGTIVYTYDANGNLTSKTSPAPNQTTTSATVTLSYCYDALNRMTAKAYTYSPSTPPTCSSPSSPPPCTSTGPNFPSPVATYTYDLSCIDSDNLFQNPVGRLIKTDQVLAPGIVANTWMDYDAMGRFQHLAQCARYNCGAFGSTPSWWIITNSYDLAGNLTQYTDGFGNTFTQNFDGASRPIQLTSSWSDSTHPATMLSVNATSGYTPSGAIAKATLGNGLTETNIYNNRLQRCRMATNSTAAPPVSCSDTHAGDVLDLTYGFGSANNGNIATWNAIGQQTFTRSFSYDNLNRISSMTETNGVAETCKPSSSSSSPYTVTWAVDPWGNLTSQTPNQVVQSNNPVCTISQSAGPNNQLSGYSYDAAGNLTGDGTNFYFYDAENRLAELYPVSPSGYQSTQPPGCSTTTVTCYFYDANGWRISKYSQGGSATTFYVYNTDGQVVADTDGNQNLNETYVHFGSQLIANYRGGWTGFFVKDHLDSTRLDTVYVPSGVTPPPGCTVPSGTTYCVYDNYDYLPFGQQIAGNNATPYKFTSKERDTESNLDNFGARFDSSSMARFMSPDWSAMPEPVPFADLDNPQSLNLYAYVENNPLNRLDGNGHQGREQLPGTNFSILKHRDNPNDMPNIHVFDKKGNEVGQLRFNGRGGSSWSGNLSSEVREQVEGIARAEGYAARAIERQAGMNAIRAARGRRGGGGAASEVFAWMVLVDIIVNVSYQKETEKNESRTGWHYDALLDTNVITDVDKAAKSFGVGSSITTGSDLTNDLDTYTLGNDGKWRDAQGNTLFNCTVNGQSGICSTKGMI